MYKKKSERADTRAFFATASTEDDSYDATGALRLRDLRRLDFQFNPNEERSVLIRRHAVLFAVVRIRLMYHICLLLWSINIMNTLGPYSRSSHGQTIEPYCPGRCRLVTLPAGQIHERVGQ